MMTSRGEDKVDILLLDMWEHRIFFKSDIEENHQGTPDILFFWASPRSYILSLSRHGNELAVGSSEGQVVILNVEGARKQTQGEERRMKWGMGGGVGWGRCIDIRCLHDAFCIFLSD